MSNMHTCIAYLTEIRKFCSKHLVHKGVNVEAQNALKLTYKHLFKKNSGGYTPVAIQMTRGPQVQGSNPGENKNFWKIKVIII